MLPFILNSITAVESFSTAETVVRRMVPFWFSLTPTFVIFVRNSGGLSMTSVIWIVSSGVMLDKGGNPLSVHITYICN